MTNENGWTAIKGVDYGAFSWDDIAERGARSSPPLVVVPSGAVEVYGPHLPLASDSIVAEAVARRVAARLDGLCAPLVPVGYSLDLMSHPGTLTVPPAAFEAYFDGICRSLVGWGFTRLLFLNTHAGNVALIDAVALRLIDECGVRCMQIDWWRYANRVAADLMSGGPWVVGHAGELGTSVLLGLSPELVKTTQGLDFEPDGDPWPSGLERYVPYRAVTESGILGSPSLAGEEKGRRIIERAVTQICTDARTHFDLTAEAGG
jgi:creatinine amidohydrolase